LSEAFTCHLFLALSLVIFVLSILSEIVKAVLPPSYKIRDLI